MKRSEGFVLVNALVLVAALAAAAVFVMSRAETGRARLSAVQTSDQLTSYLDGFEAYATSRLVVGVEAVATGAVDVDRGAVSGALIDMDRKFNINWLAAGNASELEEVLRRALATVGARAAVADIIIEAVSPGQVGNRRAYRAMDPPLNPVGGPRTLPSELRLIQGLTPSDLTKVERVATVLPSDSGLNINRADPVVVAAFFPEVTQPQIARILAQRDDAPFTSVQYFLDEVALVQGSAVGTDVDVSVLTVDSTWFEVTAQARLDGFSARRTTVLERRSSFFVPRVWWRVTTYP